MLSKLKGKMGSKGIALVRLAIWAGLIVWMLLYLAWALSVARWIGPVVYDFFVPYWSPIYAGLMRWLVPIWFIFTILLTIVIAARYANKRLRE